MQTAVHTNIIKFVNENYDQSKKDIYSLRHGAQFHDGFEGKEYLDNEMLKFLALHFIPCEIDHSWLNVLDDKAYNLPHTHSGWKVSMSGVLYLSQKNENITFVQGEELYSIEPKMFDVIIFPSNLVHYVLPSGSDKRITYAFNVRKKG